MKLLNNQRNFVEIDTDKYIILISYQTCVAYINRASGYGFRTEKKWSVTTSKHINKFFKKWFCNTVADDLQENFDSLLEEVQAK